MNKSTLTRRQTIKLGAATAAFTATFNIISPRKTAARDAKLVFWLQPNFNTTADDLLVAQTMAFAKSAGLNESDVEILKVPGGEVAPRMAAALEAGSPPDVTRVNEASMAVWKANGHLVDVTDIRREDAPGRGRHQRIGDGGAGDRRRLLRRADGPESRSLPCPHGPVRGGRLQRLPRDLGGVRRGFPHDQRAAVLRLRHGARAHSLGQPVGHHVGDLGARRRAGGRAEPAGLRFPGRDRRLHAHQRDVQRAQDHPARLAQLGQRGQHKAFQSGQVAYILNPTSVYSSMLVDGSPFMDSVGLFSPPGGPAGRHHGLNTDYYSVFEQSPNPELAKGLI
jgi:hypothetical protein